MPTPHLTTTGAAPHRSPRRQPRVGARSVLLALSLAVAGCATVDLNAPPPSPGPAPGAGTVPAAGGVAPSLGFFSRIKVPDTVDPVLRLSAKGVQVFRCERPGAGGDPAWIFRVPEAELIDDSGKVVGRHGANFSFEHTDGSRLLGNVVAYDEAPGNGNLRWLLMTSRSFGQGAFVGITHVQRVNTVGGMPPTRCEANQQNQLLRVAFSADFVFYRPR